MAIYRMIALGLCANVAGQATIELMVNPPAAGDASHGAHEAERAALLASLDRRAGYFCAAFNKMDGVSCNPAEGALYLFPKVELPPRALAQADAEGKPGDAFYAEKLLDATGICIVPGSGFGQREGTWHLRFAFLPDEHIDADEVLEGIPKPRGAILLDEAACAARAVATAGDETADDDATDHHGRHRFGDRRLPTAYAAP